MRHSDLLALAIKSYHSKTFTVNEIEVLVWHDPNDKDVVFSIRGSENGDELWMGGGWIDWFRDIRFFPTRDRHLGKAHSGFRKGAKRVHKAIIPGLCNKYKTKNIWLTGHSMGGAVSLALAKYMFDDGYNVKAWCGFGTPNLIYGEYNERPFPFPCVSYRNGSDAVTFIPRGIFKDYGMPSNTELIKIGNSNKKINIFDHSYDMYQINLSEFEKLQGEFSF